MKKFLTFTIIGILLLAGIAWAAYKYLEGLASGWGATPAYSWNLAVHSYDELVSDDGYLAHLEYVLQTRLRASYKMETTVSFDTVTEENTHITVTVTNVQVPEEVTEESFDPEWHMQNAEKRIDDTFFSTKDQSWNITSQQKECVIKIIKESVTYIKTDDITIADHLDLANPEINAVPAAG